MPMPATRTPSPAPASTRSDCRCLKSGREVSAEESEQQQADQDGAEQGLGEAGRALGRHLFRHAPGRRIVPVNVGIDHRLGTGVVFPRFGPLQVEKDLRRMTMLSIFPCPRPA
jgi:hypothetical protein